ncbi:MAG TPA: hypothetical protein VGK20_15840 [Candidatus Binatia bacterium]
MEAPRAPDRDSARIAAIAPAISSRSIASRALSAAAPGLALAVVLLLPFAGKAFTIDDTAFLREAQQALVDPLHPATATLVWSEVPRPMRASEFMPGGTLMAWLLVPSMLAGGSEIIAHLGQLLLLALAIFECAALALRLGFDDGSATLSALLLAATPAVLGMAGTVMPDVAAMSLALTGIERLLAWKQEQSVAAAVAASLCLGLAPLARGHVALILPLAPLVLDLPMSREGRRQWLPLVAAPLVAALVLFVSRDPQGATSDVVKAAGAFSSIGNVRSNAFAFGVHWVLLLPLGLAWMVSRTRSFVMSPLPWLGVAAAIVLLLSGENGPRWMWLAPVSGLGMAVVADVVLRALMSRERRELLLALWLLVPLPIVIYLHFPSKYLVACAPAAAIVAARAIRSLPGPAASLAGALLVAAGSVTGVLILSADASFADLGRRAAAELVAPHVAAGDKVWFSAHWGFQWYAERAGARCLSTVPPFPSRGDYFVTANVTISGGVPAGFRDRELVATVKDDRPGGRLIDSKAGAGFWSNGWGFLPWVWSGDELDRFDLWRLR